MPRIINGLLPDGSKPHFVYLIEDEECRTKIGHSKDPEARALDIGRRSPLLMYVGHKWPCTQAKAKEVEAALHRLFHWAQIRGEWFQVDMEDVIPIGNALFAGWTTIAAEGAALIHEIYDAHEDDDEETIVDCLKSLAGMRIRLPLWGDTYPPPGGWAD